MQLHIPDPDYTSSERARANFRLAFKIALGFVALIWLIDIQIPGGASPVISRCIHSGSHLTSRPCAGPTHVVKKNLMN